MKISLLVAILSLLLVPVLSNALKMTMVNNTDRMVVIGNKTFGNIAFVPEGRKVTVNIKAQLSSFYVFWPYNGNQYGYNTCPIIPIAANRVKFVNKCKMDESNKCTSGEKIKCKFVIK